MQAHELNAEPRDDVGKGASRRLRRSGRIPGVVYGTKKAAQSISLSHDEILHQLEREAFYSSILTININGESEKVVIKDLQRHPFKLDILHVDFQRIDEKQKITMRVPIHFLNEYQCVGVRTGGGIVSRIMTELEISCLPKDLPEYIEVDLIDIDVGESVHLSDITLPQGVEFYALQHGGDATRPVVSVNVPRVVEEPEDMAEEVEETTEALAEDKAAADQSSTEDSREG